LANHSFQNVFSSHILPKLINIKTHKSKVLPVVLYRCETWSFTLRRGHNLKVFENGAEDRMKEVIGWRKLHSKELHNLYSSSNIIRVIKSKRMRWAK
jgi:hypothetical protein